MKLDTILFDLDDTLLDWSQKSVSWQDFILAKNANIHAYLTAAGHPLPPLEEFFKLVGERISQGWEEAKKTWAGLSFAHVLRQVFTDLNLDLERIDLDEVMRVFDWGPIPGVVPYPDAIPVLTELRQRGYKIGLVTNSFHPMWMRDVELRAYDLLDFFDARVTSGDTGYMKPHPAIFWRIMGLLDTSPERAILIGDRPENDVAGANYLGMKSILMKPPHLNRELNGATPDYVITTLGELLPIVDGLRNGGESHA